VKVATQNEVAADFAGYVKAAQLGPIVVTSKGKPVAVLLRAEGEDDLERLLLGHSPKLQSILEAARTRFRQRHGIPHLRSQLVCSPKQIRQLFLILLGVVLAAGSAGAQPSHVHHWSLEARIAEADAVVIGPIAKVNRKVLIARGARTERGDIDVNGQYEYAPAVRIEQVLKGDLKGVVDDLHPRWSLGENHTYEQWMKAGNSMLWFLGPAPKPGKGRAWHAVTFGNKVPAEAYYGGRREPPMYAMDFTILQDEKAILHRARAYAKTSTKVLPIHAIRFSRPWHDLFVPVEPTLARTAKRLIESPQDFVQKWEKFDPRLRYVLRSSGVNALRYFKSDANIALLKALLADPLEDVESSLVLQHPVRVKAFEVLLHWEVDAPLPKSPDEITRLDLAGTDVTDSALKQLAELKNLTSLDLQGTKVTEKGLKELAGLKKLAVLGLGETQLSDANLRVLRAIGLLHCLNQASAEDGKRPKSLEDIVSLELCRGPVTDAGLRELAGLKKLTWLDLNDTRVTDAGLKELAGLKNLATLLLQDTQVTDAGVAELQKALPKCKIKRGAK
jgi:prevent-host-death family protein